MSKNGQTIFHAAMQGRSAPNIQSLELLIQQGVDLHVVDDWNYSPIFYAVKKTVCTCGTFLFSKNISRCIITANGETLIHAAFQMDRSPYPHLSNLIQAGVDINARTIKGFSALLLACTHNRNILGEPLGAIEQLLQNGADPNVTRLNGYGPLHVAVNSGNIELVTLLIQYKADVHKKFRGYTPLHLACLKAYNDIAFLLIQHDAKVNESDSSGRTPLILACSKNDQLAHILIESGADVHAISDKGISALHFAAKNGFVDIARLLLESGLPVDKQDALSQTALFGAIDGDKIEMIDYLVSQGAYLDHVDFRGQTPLLTAARLHRNCASHLIHLGADIKKKDALAMHSLHFFVKANNEMLIHQCLEMVDDVSEDGVSPLMLALEAEHIPLAKKLVDTARIYTLLIILAIVLFGTQFLMSTMTFLAIC